MLQHKLSQRSLQRLVGVHSDLVRTVVLGLQLSPVDFGVHEGRRTLERQKYLVKKGVSWTLKSRHLTGHAVDLWIYKPGFTGVDWNDWDSCNLMIDAVLEAGNRLGVPVESGYRMWGKDAPHFQLPGVLSYIDPVPV